MGSPAAPTAESGPDDEPLDRRQSSRWRSVASSCSDWRASCTPKMGTRSVTARAMMRGWRSTRPLRYRLAALSDKASNGSCRYFLMALIKLAEWIDRFGDDLDTSGSRGSFCRPQLGREGARVPQDAHAGGHGGPPARGQLLQVLRLRVCLHEQVAGERRTLELKASLDVHRRVHAGLLRLVRHRE